MSGDLRWVRGPVGCTDYVDDSGRMIGFVAKKSTGARGYVVDWRPGQPWSFEAIADHPDEPTVRAWVESQARPQDETVPSGSGCEEGGAGAT